MDNGLSPENGPVVVTRASGGVGGLAIDMLPRLGYEVVALTGKADQEGHLKKLAATHVKLTSTIDNSKVKPLEASHWAGAIDNVGGPILHWLLATMKQAGTVASIGNAYLLRYYVAEVTYENQSLSLYVPEKMSRKSGHFYIWGTDPTALQYLEDAKACLST